MCTYTKTLIIIYFLLHLKSSKKSDNIFKVVKNFKLVKIKFTFMRDYMTSATQFHEKMECRVFLQNSNKCTLHYYCYTFIFEYTCTNDFIYNLFDADL